MTASRFLFVGNHSALHFANTEVRSEGEIRDLLQSFRDLATWLGEAGLVERRPADEMASRWDRKPAGTRALREARAYRRLLRDALERLAAGRPLPEDLLAETNRLLARSPRHEMIVRRGDRFERAVRRRPRAPRQLLYFIAEAVSHLLSEADLSRVRKCAGHQCVLFFLDTSKNQTRRWCSMDLCGNRAKVAAHYRRQREKV